MSARPPARPSTYTAAAAATRRGFPRTNRSYVSAARSCIGPAWVVEEQLLIVAATTVDLCPEGVRLSLAAFVGM